MANMFGQIFPCFSYHNKISCGLFNLLDVTCNGRWRIFHRTSFTLPQRFFLCLSATRQKGLQNFIDEWLWVNYRLWSPVQVIPLNDVIRTSIYSYHKLRYTNKNANFILFIVWKQIAHVENHRKFSFSIACCSPSSSSTCVFRRNHW